MVRWISLITVIMLPALGCDSTSVSTSADDLIGGKWVFQRSQVPDGTVIFYSPASSKRNSWWIHFDDADYVTGWEACNECRGQFTADDDGILEFDLGGCTEKLCGSPQPYDDYWPTVQNVTRFQIRNGQLWLFYTLEDGTEGELIHTRTRCSFRFRESGYRICR